MRTKLRAALSWVKGFLIANTGSIHCFTAACLLNFAVFTMIEAFKGNPNSLRGTGLQSMAVVFTLLALDHIKQWIRPEDADG